MRLMMRQGFAAELMAEIPFASTFCSVSLLFFTLFRLVRIFSASSSPLSPILCKELCRNSAPSLALSGAPRRQTKERMRGTGFQNLCDGLRRQSLRDRK